MKVWLNSNRQLNDRQRKYVQAVAKGASPTTAAIAAGYSKTYAEQASTRIAKDKDVNTAIAAIRGELREKTMYSVEAAVVEVDRAIRFAYSKSNAMAAMKGLELKARLHGLLVDRLEVVSVNIAGAIAEANARAFARNAPPAALINGPAELSDRPPDSPGVNPTPSVSQAAPGAVRKPAMYEEQAFPADD